MNSPDTNCLFILLAFLPLALHKALPVFSQYVLPAHTAMKLAASEWRY